VVDADAEAEEALELLAVWGVEAGIADGGPDGGLLLLGGQLHAGQLLRHLGAITLGKVDQIDRRLVGLHELLDGLVEGCFAIAEVERDRPLIGMNKRRGTTASFFNVRDDGAHVAEGGGHEQKPGVGKSDEWHLPRPAPVAVGVVVELIHHDIGRVEVFALAQREVSQHLGRAADHRRVRVDAGVAGQHAHVVGAELGAEGKELLACQGLDGGGVEAPFPFTQTTEVKTEGDEGFSRPGGGVEDDVAVGHQLEQRLLLGWVELETGVRHPLEKEVEGDHSSAGHV